MSKQTAAPPSRAGAEEQSSTTVIDAPAPDAPVDKKQLARERDEVKERQKDRFTGLNKDQLIGLYRQMLLIRRFEEKSAEAYVAGKIGGFCHLYIGQEAVAVGAISTVNKEDYVFASYREHGHALAKGMSARSIMAELFGKATGCSKGKGGSMHMFEKDLGFLGGHAIVGGQIPLATGTAFASMYRNSGEVTLCVFGEAAVNQGAFHESLNMAQLWKLPCIYICENNQYGMGTSLARAMSLRDIAQKGCAYEMASEFVDGMDVLAVREATMRAVERARKESLPTLLEVRTYRFMGHSMSDPGNYRTRAEIEKYQERDPIKLFSASLLEEKILDDKALEEIDKKIREEVEDAFRFADESPLPDPAELYTDVYANPIDPSRNKNR
jgi:pyruvate dehydrogenase E1 component alpha subunit